MSIQSEIGRISNEVSDQEQTIIQIGAALTGKAIPAAASAGTRYGRAVCFGSVACAAGLMDYVAASGAYASITTYADASYTVMDLPDLVEAHKDELASADIVFLDFFDNASAAVIQNGADVLGTASLTASVTGTIATDTMTGALSAAMEAIMEYGSNAKIVWLAPARWTGASDTYMSLVRAIGGSGSVGDLAQYISLLSTLESVAMLLEATLIRTVRNMFGSVLDLGLPFHMIMFGTTYGDEMLNMMAKPIISNPFRDEPLPTLHKTVSVIADSSNTGMMLDQEPELLKSLAEMGADIRIEMITSTGVLPLLRYNGYNASDNAMMFSTTMGVEMIVVGIPLGVESESSYAYPVEWGSFTLSVEATASE